MPSAEHRSPAFFPLTLALLLLVLSAAFVLLGHWTSAEAPVAAGLPAWAAALYWLCSTGLLFGFVLALAAGLTDRHGAPRRGWAAVLAALVLIFGLGVAWAMAQAQWLAYHLAPEQAARAPAWLSGLAVAKVVAIGLVALPLAWRLGGRGATPVAWTPRQRRLLGALVGGSLCAGAALMLQNVASAYTALGEGQQRIGMSVVAAGVGLAHALACLALPVRRGPGVWPALVSALLAPALIVLVSVPLALLGQEWPMLALIAAMLAILALMPAVSWGLVRWVHGRRSGPAPQ